MDTDPIEVLLFAALREAAGRDRLAIALPPDATPADVRRAAAAANPALAPLLGMCRVAADERFLAEGEAIGDAREIALLPPVSGGHGGPIRARIVSTPIDPAAVAKLVARQDAGAVVTFTGQVRDHARGERVTHLEYEAYVPMAERVLDTIAADLERDIPGTKVVIRHRVGHLSVGDVAVVVAVSSPHRAEAFDACGRAIEALKAHAPIWKKEYAASGAVWVGMGP